MDELLVFFASHGWQLTLIALAGIIILGVLKYCNVFSKLDKKYRHILYLVISVGLSVVGSVIYLACISALELQYVLTVASATFALNQTFYAIYDTTSLKELVTKVLEWFKKYLETKKEAKKNDEGEGK